MINHSRMLGLLGLSGSLHLLPTNAVAPAPGRVQVMDDAPEPTPPAPGPMSRQQRRAAERRARKSRNVQ